MAGEWIATTLGDCVRFVSGGTPSKGNDEFWGGNIPWVSAKDMKTFWVDETEDLLTAKGVEASTFLAPEGSTLLLVRGMTLHNDIPIVRVRQASTYNQDVKAVLPKPDVLFDYVPYLLLGHKSTLSEKVDAAGHGTGRLALDALLSIPVLLPRRAEQTAIANLLGSLDDKIELNRRMAATLEEMARALFKSWFVDFDPVRAKAEGRAPGLPAATAALFPNTFGEDGLPVGWQEQSLLDQATWVNGAAYKDMHFSDAPDALPVIKIAELKNGITESTRWTNTDLGERYKITEGELLFSWSGSPDTSIDTFVWVHGTAWLNQHVFAVRPNGQASDATLFALLKYLKPVLIEIARDKQTTGLGHVTRQDMMRLKVCVADPSVRAAFDRVAEPLFARLKLVLKECARLAALRDTLLPKLISGELRIKDANGAVEAA
ncbi:MAG TPA: restriction endonuclease subunit S [Accumulibacter sp.]|nr:restriction endonuclease subunit S [Accumulibacter sp.]